MARFLIDEDLPRSIAETIKRIGHEALDSRDLGLRGKTDREVFAYAQKKRAILLTADLGFASMVRFPLGTHRGIVVLRNTYRLTTPTLQKVLSDGLRALSEPDFAGTLIIISPEKIRIRRKDK